MLSRGVWATEHAAGQPGFDTLAGEADGIVFDGWPAGRKVGVRINDLSVYWIEWWRTAEAGILAGAEPVRLMDFYNSRLGEPFKHTVVTTPVGTFSAKALASPIRPGTVPPWATLLLATADTQKDHFYYIIRAWGPRLRSCRVVHGTAATFDELRRLTLDSVFEVAGGEGRTMQPFRLGIDTGGTRTNDVYAFILTDPIRILGMRGANRILHRHIQTSRGNYRPAPDQPRFGGDLWITDIDTNYYKDKLASMIGGKLQVESEGEVIDIDQWELNADDDDAYNRQMSSEHRVQIRKGNRTIEAWEPITSGAANHWWDCETYQVSLTDVVRLGESTSEPTQKRAAAPVPAASLPRPEWMPRRGLPPPRRGFGR